MHTNLSLSRKGVNQFYEKKGKDGLSEAGWDFIGRVLAERNPEAVVAAMELRDAGGGGSGGADQNYSPSGNGGCALNRGKNVKVNQECLTISDPDLQGRGQAQNEESIAADPNDSSHIVASQNDYRRGDGNCYAAYSLNGGKNWNDSTVPTSFTRFTAQPREYWQAGGDTSVGWDTRGNAYISCQVFNRGGGTSPNPDQSSGFLVMRSTQNDGASWNFPGRYTTVFFDPSGTGGVLEDKALMAIDDKLMPHYFEWATEMPRKEVNKILGAINGALAPASRRRESPRSG
jgi:hypothetical protein